MQKILVIDSGIGGYNIFYPLKKKLKNYNIIYYKDKKNLPYGNKNLLDMKKIIFDLCTYINKNNFKCLIIACNTLSAFKYIFEKYINILIIDIIKINEEYILYQNLNDILLLATKLTINNKNYEDFFIKNNIRFKNYICYNWATDIEQHKIKNIKKELKIIKKYKEKNIFLGCTHYLTIKKILKKSLKNKNIIDPTNFVINKIINILTN